MKSLMLPVLVILAVILQTTLVPHLTLADAAPDLIFLLVVFLALQYSTTVSLWTAFWAGWVQDIAGGNPAGLNALLLVGLAYLVNLFRRQLFKEHFSAQVMIIFIFTLVHQFAAFFWLNTLTGTTFGFEEWLIRGLGCSVYNALVGPLLFQVWARWLPGENLYRHVIGGPGTRSPFSRLKSLD